MDLNAKIEQPDRETLDQVFCVDIKSEGLRDILRVILRDAYGVSLGENEITVLTSFTPLAGL